MGGWISTDRAQPSHKSWSVDFVLNLSVAAFDPFLYSHLWSWYFILWPTQDGQEPPTYFPRFQNNVCKPRTRTKQKRSGGWGAYLISLLLSAATVPQSWPDFLWSLVTLCSAGFFCTPSFCDSDVTSSPRRNVPEITGLLRSNREGTCAGREFAYPLWAVPGGRHESLHHGNHCVTDFPPE